MVGLCIFFHVALLYVFNREIKPFTFKLIIDREGLTIVILFIVFCLFCGSSAFATFVSVLLFFFLR